MIEIVRPGWEATVQDHGRCGLAHLGVPRAGAADRRSFDLGNRLLGNAVGAAALEFLLGGFVVRFTAATTFVITGAPVPAALDDRPMASDTWTYARPGQRLTAGPPPDGLRTYLGVGGGIATTPVLGSRSTDTLSGMGPGRLVAGDVLPVGPSPRAPGRPTDVVWSPCRPGPSVLRFRWGPRHDWFTSAAREAFVASGWTVSTQIDRVGARLLGPKLTTIDERQLPSEGQLLGSVQVPPSGQPIVLLANHAPTGGYPVIGVVQQADVAVLAQLPPGRELRFSPQRVRR
ncbi:MAG: biotin-dependent carboxyltransferase family protein [Propionibacteriaceae bacterium]